VVGTLHGLDVNALIEILTTPKNALIRQYQKLFEYENVKLQFEPDAIETIARHAFERKVGARGLRVILEDLMLDLMYHVPSQRKVREFMVTKQMVEAKEISANLLEKAG
jgi:ATP-dependent Clp protease ATP-binding subunit ClpX